MALDAVMARGSNTLAMMFAAAALGTVGFGQLSAIQATLIMLAGLLADSLRLTAAQQIAARKATSDTGSGRIVASVFLTSLLTTTVVAACLYYLAPLISRHVFSSGQLVTGFRISLLLLWLEVMNGLCIGILTGFRAYRNMAVAGSAAGLVLFCAVFLGTSAGVEGVLWAMTAASAVGLATRGTAVRRTLRRQNITLRLELKSCDFDTLRHLSLPAFLTGACWAPANWLVALMLLRSPDGYHQLGLLGAATQWFALLLFVPNVLHTVLLPQLASAVARADLPALRSATRAGVSLALLITVPVTCVVAGLSHQIMSLYGPGYEAGQPVLVLAALAATAGSVQNTLVNLFASTNRMWEAVATQLTWAIVFVASAALLLHLELGAVGVAAAMAIAYFAKLLHAAVRTRAAVAHFAAQVQGA